MRALRRASVVLTVALAATPSMDAAFSYHGEPVRSATQWTWVPFDSDIPCAAACAYWVDVANADVDGDGEPDIYFHVCARPFPPGSFDDHLVEAPPGADLFEFEIFPLIDSVSAVHSP